MLSDKDYIFGLKMINRMFPKIKKWIKTTIHNNRMPSKVMYQIEDVVLLTILMHLFRYRSLYSFTKEFRENKVAAINLFKYFKIKEVLSDDTIRYVLRLVSSDNINKLLQMIHQRLERKKIINKLKFIDNNILISIDGSGHFSSYNISCPKCMTKVINDKILFMHQQLAATIVSSESNCSFTLLYEAIENTKDSEYCKNDCGTPRGVYITGGESPHKKAVSAAS